MVTLSAMLASQRALIRVSTAPVPIQLPGNDLGEASAPDFSVWTLATLVGDREEAPRSWL